ncbi:VIT1/CCC1 transporter family protein [Corynebacterium alimapuense]|uniref:Rubrerythrin family protein n=1 Tax=Corynebacterium alimapuense TaxID=1576874 RepID=A0A3M8KAN2_9CORY|nr:VIT1/CCC1 transporter family protein [Corynebacterium alimapuense]RNE49582.1 rubrerythrin family protein [Corynebacterium alimapuense]
MDSHVTPTNAQISRWRRYLANERAEAAVYRELAHRKTGEEREILLALAESEARHEGYWRDKLGDYVGFPRQPDLGTRFVGFLAKRFGSVFTLALMQTAESRSPYITDVDASEQIAADERIHAEVVRGLATRSREKMSGGFRAAVFGANDGLVSNLALVVGVMGSGVGSNFILITGMSGLLAGALSMAAGEWVSVKSQNELLEASTPRLKANTLLPELDVNANELVLVYRARGLSEQEAVAKADEEFSRIALERAIGLNSEESSDEDDTLGRQHTPANSEWAAAISSFLFFAVGAFIPIIPFLFGATPVVGAIIATILVSGSLLITGGVVGVLSGKSPLTRGFRQLLIGIGAAGITYLLGLTFGAVVG